MCIYGDAKAISISNKIEWASEWANEPKAAHDNVDSGMMSACEWVGVYYNECVCVGHFLD